MAGDAKFIITRFIPAKGLLNTLGYSTEMLDEASIDASRINQPPSSSSRPIPCSEGVQIYMECTVRTIQVDKAHLWSHSSKKHQSFPQRHWAALLMDTSTRTGAPTIRAHHTSPSAGSKSRSSQSSCTSWLLWDLWHSAGNQPAEEAAVVSVPTQSTDKWLMGNACFMLEQMAFLWPVCVSIQENRLLVTKAPYITNRVFSD